jgi:hypothetical protein
MICRNCGAEFEDGNLCPNCGTKYIKQYRLLRLFFASVILILGGSLAFMGDAQIFGHTLIDIFYFVAAIAILISIVGYFYMLYKKTHK